MERLDRVHSHPHYVSFAMPQKNKKSVSASNIIAITVTKGQEKTTARHECKSLTEAKS